MAASLLSRRAPRWTLPATVEQLVVCASAYWTLTANTPFFKAALKTYSFTQSATWAYAAALVVLVFTVHFTLLTLLATRWSIKPLLAVLIPITALASYSMQSYGVYLDPSMLRNVLHTHFGEARELVSLRMGAHLALYAALPLALLSRVQVTASPGWRGMLRGLGKRLLQLLAAITVLVLALWAQFQPIASLARNHHEVRYLLTPLNYLSALVHVAHAQARSARAPHERIKFTAHARTNWAERKKPFAVILVIGETVRAANWGLSGYPRPTTPELAGRTDLISFPSVSTCGTNTEVSVPCMFSPGGKHAYNLARVQGEESLLQTLARAGIAVQWRDNQSGCKGVCDGLPGDTAAAHHPSGLCDGQRCFDEALVDDLPTRLSAAHGAQLWVMHTLGNHGPAYWRRYPKAFEFFVPACHDDELAHCAVPEIVNAYDNALRYTDHVLAQTINALKARSDQVDSVLIYLPDHGESLGEHNLFLHGAPEIIAPAEQTHVPMVIWMSEGAHHLPQFKTDCLQAELKRRSALPTSHDYLYHTLMGLFNVRASTYAPQWDLTQRCQRA